eukprot:g28788.t1
MLRRLEKALAKKMFIASVSSDGLLCDLRNRSFTTAGIQSITELREFSSLRSLDLCGNALTDEAAEAVADGLERGLSPEQVYAIRDFWNFKGADELIEDLEGKIPYHVALRGEKADPSLASRYYASERGWSLSAVWEVCGNVVSEKIAEVRLHGEEERSEVHTLKLHPPSRKMIQAREDESTPQDEDVSVHEYEEDEERSEEVEIHENSGGEESNESDEEASSTDSSVKEESKDGPLGRADHHVLIAASAMETNYSVHRMEVVEIPELDADNVRAAVARAKVSAHYMQSARIQGKADDKSPKALVR